jgi:hypothetical protein
MNRTRTYIALTILLIASLLVVIGRQRSIIDDQRQYIDNGCRGRYQGEGS